MGTPGLNKSPESGFKHRPSPQACVLTLPLGTCPQTRVPSLQTSPGHGPCRLLTQGDTPLWPGEVRNLPLWPPQPPPLKELSNWRMQFSIL